MNYQTQLKLKRWLNQPVVTYFLLAVTTLVFLATEIDGGSTKGYTLVKWGAMVHSAEVLQFGQSWRFIAPIFLHIGWTHFILNMVTLYFIGPQIESIYGHWRYLLLYFFSGIAGNIASFAFGTMGVISAGASTSLFGLFGAFIILGRHFPNDSAIRFMVQHYSIFVLINLVFNLFSSSVDIMGHVGGLIGGLLIANILSVPKKRGTFDLQERILSGIILFVLVAFCLFLSFRKYGLLV